MRHSIPPLVLLLLAFPAFPQTTQPASPLTGQVLSAPGTPVENATIVAMSSPGGDESVLATAASNAAGRFTCTPPTPAKVVFSFLPNVGFAPPQYPPSDEPLRFQLAPAIDCQVAVQLPDGSPAAGIPVRPTLLLFPDPSSPIGRPIFFPAAISQQLAVTTDPAGHALFHGLPKNSTVRFDIDDPRFAHTPPTAQSPLEGDPTLIHITLPKLVPAAAISGQLLNPQTHQPLANIPIGARSISPETGGYGSATSDATGNFTVSRLTPGTYALTCSDPASQTTGFVATPLEIQLTAGQNTTAAFTLTHGALLRGQVLDSQSGQPVTGVTIGVYIYARPNGPYQINSAPVDAQGRFQLRTPPGLQHAYFMAIPDDYLHPPQQGAQDVTLADGQTADLTFNLPPDLAPVIEGTVIGPDNKPVAQATVTLQTRDLFGSRQVTADNDGRFHLHANPGTPLRASFKDLATPQPLPALADKPMTLRLEKKITFALSVTFVDESNHPVPTAALELIAMQGSFGLGSQPHPADKKGVARIENLPVDGKYTISGSAPGFGVAQQNVQQLPKGNPYDTVLVLHPEDSQIAGTVIDGAGHPLPGITVRLNGGNTGSKTVTTDPQGRFSFAVVSNGEGLVYLLDASGQLIQSANAKAGQTDIRFTTSAPATQP